MALVRCCILIILVASVRFCTAAANAKFSKHITTAQRIQSHGYPAETHHVETPDGYILGVFRIPFSHKLQNQNARRPVVLLFHGLLSCSDAFILTGPNSALAYNLADAGFDVWMGNARGNYYSRNSTVYSLQHPHFWRFSWHEIGYFDVTSMIDYALMVSGEKMLHYIGHSQATTTFLAGLSSRPEYNEKLKTAHLLAPVAFMSNVEEPLLTRLAKFLGHDGVYSALFGSQEFLPQNNLFMMLGYQMCGENTPSFALCSSAAMLLEGYAPNANTSIFPILAETHPAGASTDQIVHYMQSISTGQFRRFDYGAKKNAQVYGQTLPPAYELQKVTTEITLYFSDNDNLAVPADVWKLATQLPNVKKMHYVEDPTWAHADFTWATRAHEEINIPIIAAIREYEELQVYV